jgi:hypothetical protein
MGIQWHIAYWFDADLGGCVVGNTDDYCDHFV